ncbi:MAG: hypothetical protein NVSMB18_16000 [Acetobacteraceae bacterium]
MAWRKQAARALLAALVLRGCTAPEEDRVDYVVTFAGPAEQPDGVADTVLDAAARAAIGHTVRVEGYADRTGTPPANLIRSRLRAQAVADALVRRGVDKARVSLHPRTAIGGDPGVESRRVEVVITR